MTKREEKQHDLEFLRGRLTPSTPILTTLRHRAASGMSRWYDVYYVNDRRELIWLSGYVAIITGNMRNDHGVRVGGCGFDGGHSLAYHLFSALWPDLDYSEHLVHRSF